MSYCTYVANFSKPVRTTEYSLRPYIIVVIGVRATSLTRFIEYAYNICIFK
jgi:hypothetical protein